MSRNVHRNPRSVWPAVWLGAGALFAGLLAAPAAGSTVVGGVNIYGPQEVEGFVVGEGEDARLDFPGAMQWAFAADSACWWPMPVAEVVEAVKAVGYPADVISATILVLARPRRDLPQSSAEGTVILLSPGSAPYPAEHVHCTVAHEMGHVLHNMLMPDSRQDLWAQYAGLRGVDLASSSSNGGHASRIHEIFAEDFRVVFGGPSAQCGSGVENHDLAPPEQVAGLKEFFLSLPEVWKSAVRTYVGPNPFRDRLTVGIFSLDGEAGIAAVSIYDVGGRLVSAIRPSGRASREVTWDGRDTSGADAAAGAYFAAVTVGSRTQVVKVLRMPR